MISLERELIHREHAGWLKQIDKSVFQLRRSPFNTYTKPQLYILPSEMKVNEGEFVELDVGRPSYANLAPLRSNGTVYSVENKTYEVMNFEKLSLWDFIHKPYLREDEFISRLEQNWRNGKEDFLGRAIAIQIMSCPPSNYGVGGIGSQSINTGALPKANLTRLRRTISNALPKGGFEISIPQPETGFHSQHKFKFIDNNSQELRITNERTFSNKTEISYNRLDKIEKSSATLPIQFPTIIYNSKYRAATLYPDWDVTEYILTSSLYNPAIPENLLPTMKKSLQKMRDEQNPRLSGKPLDLEPNSTAKLASAIGRLHLSNKVTEDMYLKSTGWMNELLRLYWDVADPREFKGGSTSYLSSKMESFNEYNYTGQNDYKVKQIIWKLQDETGEKFIPEDKIVELAHKQFKISYNAVCQALYNLTNRGHIYWRNRNGMEYDIND